MNNSPDQITQARTLLETSKEVVIALPSNPALDSVAAALALYLGLSTKGIQVNVVCPDPMTVEFSHLVGIDKVTNDISIGKGKNLVISFPYQEGSIEKVSYNIENDSFNLVIEPREGYPLVTQEAIRFSNSGGNTDLIITVGVSKLSDLTAIYNSNQGYFTSKPILNIDANSQNAQFGKVNVVDGNISSVSELMTSLFSNIGLSLNADIATNLLAGLSKGTQNLSSPKTQASTYEAAAMCMRSGARKIIIEKSDFREDSLPKPIKSFAPQPLNKPFMGVRNQPQPRPFQPQVQPQPQQQQQPPKKQSNDAPPDWLKPKIYKGSTLL